MFSVEESLKFLKKGIQPVYRWLNQVVIVVLIPEGYKYTFTIRFRPFWPILFLLLVAFIGGASSIVLVQSAKLKLAVTSAERESNRNREELSSINSEIDGMVELMSRFQNTLSVLKDEEKQIASRGGSGNRDFIDVTSAVGVMGNTQMSDLDRLKSLNVAIEDSLSPLKKTLQLLENERKLLRELPTFWPVDSDNMRISFLFGPNLDPITHNRWYLHRGLDIANAPGTPVVAAADGKVVEAEYQPYGYGYYVEIKHKYGIYTLYAHQQRLFVSVGDYVTQGQRIGLMGSTGRVTGPHLHFEIRIGTQIIDPVIYLRMSEVNRKVIDRVLDRKVKSQRAL